MENIGKRLSQEPKIVSDKFSDIGKAWGSKLRELNPQQAIHAEKIINDVFYEAQLENLNRNCFLQISKEISCHTQPSLPTHHSYNFHDLLNTQQPVHTQPSTNYQTTSNHSHFNVLQPVQNLPSLNLQSSFQKQVPCNEQIKKKPYENKSVAKFFEDFTDL